MRLRLLQVVHRHGDRSPLHNVFQGIPWLVDHENAIWSTRLHGPTNDSVYGHLTTLGMRQMQARGLQLRQECLKQGWTLDENAVDVNVYSTPYERTQQSVLGLLSQFLPHAATDDTIQVLPKHLNFINAYSAAGNVIVPLKMKMIEEHPVYSVDDKRMEPIRKELIHRLPMFHHNMEEFTWMKAADHFVCRQAHELVFIPDTEELAQPTIDHLSLRFLQAHPFYSDPIILKLVVKDLASKLLHEMEHCIKTKQSDKECIQIYSGHDVSLLALLYALDSQLQHPFWPDYSSAVVLELSQDNSDWYVRATLDGKPVLEEPIMPFKAFAQLLQQKMN